MKKRFKDVEFLFPKKFDIYRFKSMYSLEPFSDESIGYLNALSKKINEDVRTRNYPDVATFAFFCRKANLVQLKKAQPKSNNIRLGRGIIFHVAPSNVPVNFAYSFLSGILAGNLNIVRVSSKRFIQVDIICKAVDKLSQIKKHQTFSDRLVFVRYDRQNIATAIFSSVCDVRIIWGGDETIAQIRRNSLPPRSFDVTFADRYSLCAINADAYINETNPEEVASGFYNDTYLFDQNACTAPHLVVWLGTDKNVKLAKTKFWDSLYEIVKRRYYVEPVVAVDKLTSFYNQAIHTEKIAKEESDDNLIWRIKLQDLTDDIDEHRCMGGYFSEYHASSLLELAKITNRKYQTLAYYGFEVNELIHFINESKPSGIDRIVPIGRTTDFSLNWDGFNLINMLSRCCEIK